MPDFDRHPAPRDFFSMVDPIEYPGKVRIQVVGGFLGAGKTTALLRMADYYAARGLRVGIIANDQAEGLVDTETFRSQGWRTEEIAGGCFCCRLDDFVVAADRIVETHRPDVLLCEPVGSCTDIVATVIRPLSISHADRFQVAPYVVLLDPHRARQSLTTGGRAGFSAKVTYIFQMQQNEAAIIAINKADTLAEAEREELRKIVAATFVHSEVTMVSARTGEGFDLLLDRLNGAAADDQRRIEVDYDVYAEGEARLGWLNAEFDLKSETAFSLDTVLVEIAGRIGDVLREASAEPAHVKLLLQHGRRMARASIVSSLSPAELSQPSGMEATEARLLVNARVEEAPDRLHDQVRCAIGEVAHTHGVSVIERTGRAFRPGRPVPTNRVPGTA